MYTNLIDLSQIPVTLITGYGSLTSRLRFETSRQLSQAASLLALQMFFFFFYQRLLTSCAYDRFLYRFSQPFLSDAARFAQVSRLLLGNYASHTCTQKHHRLHRFS